MNRYIACILLLALVVSVSATKYSDCGSTTGKVQSVEVTDCPDGDDPCILKKGTQPEVSIKFTSTADSKTLKTVIHGVIAGVPIPFPVPKSDACKTGVSCPIKSGQSNTYTNKFNVRKSYPSLNVVVRYELKDETNSNMVCVEIECKLE